MYVGTCQREVQEPGGGVIVRERHCSKFSISAAGSYVRRNELCQGSEEREISQTIVWKEKSNMVGCRKK